MVFNTYSNLFSATSITSMSPGTNGRAYPVLLCSWHLPSIHYPASLLVVRSTVLANPGEICLFCGHRQVQIRNVQYARDPGCLVRNFVYSLSTPRAKAFGMARGPKRPAYHYGPTFGPVFFVLCSLYSAESCTALWLYGIISGKVQWTVRLA
ncbi:hypothetical protein BU24DRAFT_428371 [Aaosphaeria arxii CBS 175.79]|uniref:Uncharacterized protein n=1 Tax=Aaosphaeria arxii CBS 175.79 TaxID=1450172 RepID=A0A6A5X980_9PLEO|nr:uncharacterized protein BU24DRAFT_428371 [Aaosphaeria arxii CBS 175.79]KAF2009470.1 hypothetical protein BU24DRAFT_428371 [Aaosphaeria arxii CBS 175.79]